MRILAISTWDPYPPDNGARIRAFHLLRELASQHRVTLISFCPRLAPPLAKILADVETHYIAEDAYRYTHARQLTKWLSPRPLAYAPHPAMRLKVNEVAASGRWDAFVAIGIPAAVYHDSVDAPARIVDIDTALSYWTHEELGRGQGGFGRARLWVSWQKGKASESGVLREFHAATLVSPIEIEYVRCALRAAHLDLRVVSNGIDCTRNRPGLSERASARLVYNGSLTYAANYDAMRWFLAEIYPLVRTRRPDVGLTITGSVEGVDLGGLRIDDSVELTGFVEDVRLPVEDATVCVVPLRQGGGTRLKILEAMALGTAVVSTTKGAEGLEVTGGENIALADEPARFAQRVLELLEDGIERDRLARSARQLVESNYDWSLIAPRFRKLVEDTVTRHQRSA